MNHAASYLRDVQQIAERLDLMQLAALAGEIRALQQSGGRLFVAGLGGSAANASHAAADFRRLAGVQAHALADNVAELTAIANDVGWKDIYTWALRANRANAPDALMVLSVGGGTDDVSRPLVEAIDYAKDHGMRVLGIVGPVGGYTKRKGDTVLLIPTVGPVTPHTEAFQGVVLHYLVSHPDIQRRPTKW
jgi:D-sedoheptulose 7-phosphate isomerase